LVDATTGETRRVFKDFDFMDGFLASPKGNLLAARDPGRLVLWELDTDRLVREARVDPPDNGYTANALSPDGSVLAIGYGRGKIELWDVANLELRATLWGHSQAILHLALSPDCLTLVSEAGDGTSRLWDVTTGEELLTLVPPPGAYLTRPQFSPDGRTLGFCAVGGGASTWLDLVPRLLPEDLTSEEGP
jgi:WD40 repeat protein